jgi:hypothetical protein
MVEADKTGEQKSKIEIFVSYAREDLPLVREIAEELKKPFGLGLHFFIDDRSTEYGDEWRDKINDALDGADMLFIVSTGQKRDSHSFTGYEIGYFSKSIRERPKAGTVKRHIIPLIIGDRPPIAVSDIQGIMIPKENFFNLEIKPGDLSSEGKFMQIVAGRNPFRNLLFHLRDMMIELSKARLSNSDMEDWNRNIDDCAGRLYRKIFIYLQSCIFLELYPERKLIIRTACPPGPSDEEAMLENSTIDFVGDSFDMFGFRERPTRLPWQSFVPTINPPELATQWQDAIRTLVSDAFNGVPTENYAFVRSSQIGRSFRLFVSLVRTYYSEQKEVHIYIVEVARTKDYGDTTTTKLAKAVDIGLRYRSLFLESKSPFSPKTIAFLLSKEDLRSGVKDMWRELQHLLVEGRQAHLADPELLAAIYGDEGHQNLDDLAALWQSAEGGLSRITHDLLATSDDKIMAMKSAILTALKEFCDKTEQMNREYTARSLRALDARLTSNAA